MTTSVGEDQGMSAILEVVQEVAPTSIPVLIRGARGTDKELVARAIHENSRDPSLPFLAVDLAALPEELLAAKLTGYLKGAFPGAGRGREGIFAQARGGTVFLDEIALLPPAFQGTLLRILQEHTVMPLGSATERPVAFRLVTATSRRLRECIATGLFREDLYYRLQAVTIDLPPPRTPPAGVLLRRRPLSRGAAFQRILRALDLDRRGLGRDR